MRVYTREAETLTRWMEGYWRGVAWSVGRRSLVPSRKRQPQLPKLLHHAHTMATPKNKNICKVILPARMILLFRTPTCESKCMLGLARLC